MGKRRRTKLMKIVRHFERDFWERWFQVQQFLFAPARKLFSPLVFLSVHNLRSAFLYNVKLIHEYFHWNVLYSRRNYSKHIELSLESKAWKVFFKIDIISYRQIVHIESLKWNRPSEIYARNIPLAKLPSPVYIESRVTSFSRDDIQTKFKNQYFASMFASQLRQCRWLHCYKCSDLIQLKTINVQRPPI